MKSLVGVYGGTFNPIHLGHLRAAEEVVEALGLERMIFVPSAEPPHKQRRESVIAPAQARLEWTHLAVRGNARFEVDAIEVDRAGPSFLVDTLREWGERLTPRLPIFTLGHDAFAEMSSWREPEALFRLAHFAVMTRPPLHTGSLDDWLPEIVRDEIEISPDGRSGRHRAADTWIRLVEITGLDISASKIRQMIGRGVSTRYLLPEEVRAAIEQSGHYTPLCRAAKHKASRSR
ncbi:MAG: nicotinate-nucleotide adenylyltransferase [Myxococcota bacterium]